jgi:predicted SprT family Zn-dependent metalloprotease
MGYNSNGGNMTYADVKNLFNQFNTEFFHGVLPAIEIKLEKRKTSRLYGQYRWTRRFGVESKKIRIFPIAIESGNAEETLYHEMVHYYLHYSGRPCGHTSMFKAMMSKFLGKQVKNRFIQKTKQVPLNAIIPQAIIEKINTITTDPKTLNIGDIYQGQKITALETKQGQRIAFKLETIGWVKL